MAQRSTDLARDTSVSPRETTTVSRGSRLLEQWISSYFRDSSVYLITSTVYSSTFYVRSVTTRATTSVFYSISFSTTLSQFVHSVISLLYGVRFSTAFVYRSVSRDFSSGPRTRFLVSSGLVFVSLIPSTTLSVVSPVFRDSS